MDLQGHNGVIGRIKLNYGIRATLKWKTLKSIRILKYKNEEKYKNIKYKKEF